MQKQYDDVMQPNDNMQNKVCLSGLTNSKFGRDPYTGSMEPVLET